MSGFDDEGFLAKDKRKKERNTRFVFVLAVLAVIGIAAAWHYQVGPFNKPVPAPEPTRAAAVIPPSASKPTPMPSASSTPDAKPSKHKK